MTSGHRRAHVAIWLALTPLLMAAALAALWARRAAPVQDAPPLQPAPATAPSPPAEQRP